MNRITKKCKELKKSNKIAFMPFIVAGDPGFEASLKIAKELTKSADFLEIGFPYSDPLADGPTIQAANQRALRVGMNTDRVLEFIRKIRTLTEVPITVLIYANLVYQMGIPRFYREARKVGIDGVLIPDLPVEESRPYVTSARKSGVSPIFLVTQTTNNQRLRKILQYAEGYLYLVSVLGVTGERESLPQEILTLIDRVRTQTDLPLAVGFGVSKEAHVRMLKEARVDGYIIGSALIRVIEENMGDDKKILKELSECVKVFTHV